MANNTPVDMDSIDGASWAGQSRVSVANMSVASSVTAGRFSVRSQSMEGGASTFTDAASIAARHFGRRIVAPSLASSVSTGPGMSVIETDDQSWRPEGPSALDELDAQTAGESATTASMDDGSVGPHRATASEQLTSDEEDADLNRRVMEVGSARLARGRPTSPTRVDMMVNDDNNNDDDDDAPSVISSIISTIMTLRTTATEDAQQDVPEEEGTRGAAARGQGSASFGKLNRESIMSAAGSIMGWIVVLIMFPTVGDPCAAAQPVKSWEGFGLFALAYLPNLVLLQAPSAVGNSLAMVLVMDHDKLSPLATNADYPMPGWVCWHLFHMLWPRLLLQVIIKYYFSLDVAGGMVILANLVCSYFIPLTWSYDRWRHHNRVTLPVMYIYVAMAALCFFLLPRLMTQDETSVVHYIAGPAIMAVVEAVVVGGVALAMWLSTKWDNRNMSTWSRTISTMFLAFKAVMLTNPRLSWEVLAGTAAVAVITEFLFWYAVPLARMSGAASVARFVWRKVSNTPPNDEAERGAAQEVTFYHVYLASKKDSIIAPLLALASIKLVHLNPFPELVNCKTGEVFEEVMVEWPLMGIFALTVAMAELLPPLVQSYFIKTANPPHMTRGIRTVVTPPTLVMRVSLYLTEAAVMLFAMGQALLLVPGGPHTASHLVVP